MDDKVYKVEWLILYIYFKWLIGQKVWSFITHPGRHLASTQWDRVSLIKCMGSTETIGEWIIKPQSVVYPCDALNLPSGRYQLPLICATVRSHFYPACTEDGRGVNDNSVRTWSSSGFMYIKKEAYYHYLRSMKWKDVTWEFTWGT